MLTRLYFPGLPMQGTNIDCPMHEMNLHVNMVDLVYYLLLIVNTKIFIGQYIVLECSIFYTDNYMYF